MSEREKLIEAMGAFKGWLDFLEHQVKRSKELGQLASARRRGEISHIDARRKLAEFGGNPKVFDGAALENGARLFVKIAALPGLSDVLEGKAVIVPVEATAEMVSAGTYQLADHLCASEYVNGPDASVVLALAHTSFVGAFAASIAASPYRSKTDE